jgi:hypothetical protein
MDVVQTIKTVFGAPEGDDTPEERKISAASRTIGKAVLLAALVGVASLFVWAWGMAEPPGANAMPSLTAVLGANLLVGTAAAAAGAVFGFIFGIPRTLNPADRAAVANAVTQDSAAAATATHAVMAANTNLERISDWLTTLLIGATLVQIKDIAAWVGSLGKSLVKTGPLSNDAIVPVIVILFFSLAFLGVYLITRLYLTTAFMQTLGILTGKAAPADAAKDKAGPADPAKDDARKRANATTALNAKVKAAVDSGKASDLQAALKSVDDAKPSEVDRGDPALNANIARALAKLLNAKAAADPAKAANDLKTAVDGAIKSPDETKALMSDLAAGALTTGETNLDNDIRGKLSA